jgi:hypothetical protein
MQRMKTTKTEKKRKKKKKSFRSMAVNVIGGVALLLAIVVAVACNSGPNLATGSRVDDGDKDGVSAARPDFDPGLPPSFPSKPPPPAMGGSEGGYALPEIPFVACSNEITPEAGPLDSGDGTAPCDTPPPSTCTSRTERVEWLPGPCVNNRCVFSPYITSCPKGCFRQVDGGEGCAR